MRAYCLPCGAPPARGGDRRVLATDLGRSRIVRQPGVFISVKVPCLGFPCRLTKLTAPVIVPVVVSRRPFSRGFVPSGQSRRIFTFLARLALTVQSVSAPTTVN